MYKQTNILGLLLICIHGNLEFVYELNNKWNRMYLTARVNEGIAQN